MSVAFALIERTPHRLRWRATSTAVGTAACDSGVIRNRSDGTDAEGLRTNSSAGTPIGRIARSAATSQAAARRKLNGEALVGAGLSLSPDLGVDGGTSTRVNIERARLSITPEDSDDCDGVWTVDADDGGAHDAGSDNFPVIVVGGPNTTGHTAIVSLEFQHSAQR